MSAAIAPLTPVELLHALREHPTTRRSGLTTLHYQVELLTPMFGGGVQPRQVDWAMPIRTRSIRGQLRHWWRLSMRDSVSSPAHPLHTTMSAATPEAWRTLEFSRWGGMVKPPQSPQASRIGVDVLNPREFRKCSFNELSKPLQYGYFPANPRDNVDVNDAIVAPGAKFNLRLHVPESLKNELHAAVIWWATLGGIGGRTQRGAGAVAVRYLRDGAEASHLLSLFTEDNLRQTAGAVHRRLFRSGCVTTWLAGASAGGGFPSAATAHAHGLSQLKQFRQGEDVAREPKSPHLSRWPEAHSLRCISHVSVPAHAAPASFAGNESAPRAAFGLPIVMFFKDGPMNTMASDEHGRDPARRTLVPVDPGRSRMASPLILRPIAIQTVGGIQYASAAVLLNRGLLEGGVQGAGLPTHVKAQPSQAANAPGLLPVALPRSLPSSLDAYRRGKAFPMATNAVEMFLNFFTARR